MCAGKYLFEVFLFIKKAFICTVTKEGKRTSIFFFRENNITDTGKKKKLKLSLYLSRIVTASSNCSDLEKTRKNSVYTYL